MPDTFQALAVVGIALLPGALLIWAFERTAGRWTIETSDRLLRFVGVSAAIQALLAPLIYYVYATKISNQYLKDAKPLSWWFWIAALLYVLVPYSLGRLFGVGARDNWPWLRGIVGRQPVPRAWDYAFLSGRTGWVRLRLKSPEQWIVGAWAKLEDGRESFASPFPQAEALFLVRTIECNERTGDFVLGPDNKPILRPEALLVRWDEVQFLEFIDG